MTCKTPLLCLLIEPVTFCRTLRVNQMRELVQAIDDEADRDQKREAAERAIFDKPQQLHDLKKQNREQRRIGKQYVESLQRDHEVSISFQKQQQCVVGG